MRLSYESVSKNETVSGWANRGQFAFACLASRTRRRRRRRGDAETVARRLVVHIVARVGASARVEAVVVVRGDGNSHLNDRLIVRNHRRQCAPLWRSSVVVDRVNTRRGGGAVPARACVVVVVVVVVVRAGQWRVTRQRLRPIAHTFDACIDVRWFFARATAPGNDYFSDFRGVCVVGARRRRGRYG